MKAANLF